MRVVSRRALIGVNRTRLLARYFYLCPNPVGIPAQNEALSSTRTIHAFARHRGRASGTAPSLLRYAQSICNALCHNNTVTWHEPLRHLEVSPAPRPPSGAELLTTAYTRPSQYASRFTQELTTSQKRSGTYYLCDMRSHLAGMQGCSGAKCIACMRTGLGSR